MQITVIEYVLSCLDDLGIDDVFGVAGDYAFPIEDAVCNSNTMRWIGNCNELNAAYAADGYARVKGAAALSTTFGVGELSAMNGIAGAYAENLPIFHLVGMPASTAQENKKLVHHTLGNGQFDIFYKMSQNVVCAHAIMTPDNCIEETKRLIAYALKERKPVYMGFPSDYAVSPVKEQTTTKAVTFPESDPVTLDKAVKKIVEKLTNSKTACVMPGILSARLGFAIEVQAIIDQSNLPYTTMFMDKSVLSEANPQYIGMYNGHLLNKTVQEYVEHCDCILGIGAMLTDFNTGSFTAQIPNERYINIMPDHVKIGLAVYHNIYMKDVLAKLKDSLPKFSMNAPKATGLGEPVSGKDGKITAEYFYARLEKMFKKDDIIFAETGNSSMGLGFAHLPENAKIYNQTLWGSIGWATPAAFGAAVAEPNRRVILITGEGSHQLTAQEISQFARFGLKPIVIVLNNDGYLIERLLCNDPETYYNNLAQWNYSELPKALGCNDWECKQVTNCQELDAAIQQAEQSEHASYIEVMTDRYAASELGEKMKESKDTLY
ncbi:TPP-dependent 2-oxoacid decarboxylase [Commensalibacter communis]|uniref:Includes indolepyruvate decarboxylase (PDC1) n=1 Tax=Commensalibacter communis TaxID=2972786 RepID=A0A9W4TN70_9PROT|nr:thiamine pyrophosphate-binding protein [Commensalibacter communis]CAI3947737.1 TPP-dependent 2-oxoacid decarboxylase [Commensalibacter communis]CAI3948195.1 TPP-dependent 2-oxoacid decarboxylase [Commensalibacter communis]CAI3949711.1 TPP-dependent 2-oxoacid decarboxylase [Commensalibacter communis]CAI3950660.1 TPP-dependent 2-oxoacid decarboxylase [Commensalibacter communis]CAI3954035.1 TPP-dependent 2-oxoacid decarboxylase [Commensalibacter communis]